MNEKEMIMEDHGEVQSNKEKTVRIIDEDENVMKDVNSNQPVVVLKNGKVYFSHYYQLLIKGGYWDGKFLLFNLENGHSCYYPTDDSSKVTCVDSDVSERFLFVGTSSGRLFIYDIKSGSNVAPEHALKLTRMLTDQDSQINYISVCNRLNVVVTLSSDKTCNLYTYPLVKLFRVIKTDPIIFDYVFISAAPLPSIVMYSKQSMIFHSYSINGEKLSEENDGVKYLFSPIVLTDNIQQDHLVISLLKLDVWDSKRKPSY